MAPLLFEIQLVSGFGCFGLFPSAFWRLGDESFFDGAGRDADVTHFAAGENGLYALQIRQETALGDGRDVRADAALFLGLATAPDDAALHRAFAGQFTNVCHKILNKELRRLAANRPVASTISGANWKKMQNV